MSECFDQMSHERQLCHLESVARRALPAWGIQQDASVSLLSLSENATWMVRPAANASGFDPDQPLILRVHRTGYHSRDAIRTELAWMNALQTDAGVITPQAIPAANGDLIHCVETPSLNESRFVELFEFIDGQAPDETHLMEPFHRLGKVTAQLHQHAMYWQRPEFFERLVWDFDGCLGERKLWGDWRQGPGLTLQDIALLERVEERIEKRLQAYGSSPERFGLIHADLRLANLLEVDGETRVIDFDDAGLGWFLYDLASAVSFIETRDDLPELVDAWLQGYLSQRPLLAADVAMIPTFIMLRRMTLLAWIGSHSENDLAKSQGKRFTQGTRELAEQYLSDTFLVNAAELEPVVLRNKTSVLAAAV